MVPHVLCYLRVQSYWLNLLAGFAIDGGVMFFDRVICITSSPANQTVARSVVNGASTATVAATSGDGLINPNSERKFDTTTTRLYRGVRT